MTTLNTFIITLPIHMDFKSWAAAVVQDLRQITIPLPEQFKDWRDWFNALQEFKELGEVPTVTKQLYPNDDDWRRAAIQFINNIPVK